jgi:hypothetical protein
MPVKRHVVPLTRAEREQPETHTETGKCSFRAITRSRIKLLWLCPPIHI